MSSTKKVAVAGATGRVGHHVVDVLTERGQEVVRISRTHGVDVITGAGLVRGETSPTSLRCGRNWSRPAPSPRPSPTWPSTRNPGPYAKLGGPTFAEWLNSVSA
jgi:hypothetical protein